MTHAVLARRVVAPPSRPQRPHDRRTSTSALDAQGRSRFEFQAKRNGKTTRITLKAQTPTDAVHEAEPPSRRLRRGRPRGRLAPARGAGREVPGRVPLGRVRPGREGALAASTLDALRAAARHATSSPPSATRPGHGTCASSHLRSLIDRMRLDGLSGSHDPGHGRGALARCSASASIATVLADEPRPRPRRRPPLGGARDGADRTSSRGDLDRLLDELERRVPARRGDLRVRRDCGSRRRSASPGRTSTSPRGEIVVRQQLGRDGRSLAHVEDGRVRAGSCRCLQPLAVELRGSP